MGKNKFVKFDPKKGTNGMGNPIEGVDTYITPAPKVEPPKEEYGAVEVSAVSFVHMYQVSGFFEPTTKRHVCLENGYWCPQNALRHPQDIIKYLKRKLK